ncbi:MAG TPA: dihydrodipicolinate reductase C-terminal domain-containing protein [Pyrinomonadaceae bacterium]|nr:dihydrodipicolinate reductase C-terminal domain-containing protein [Pyrinomonadaceae bacterium]
MKIALIGYGSMGKEVERLALERGFEVTVAATGTDSGLSSDRLSTRLMGFDAAIDFSNSSAVFRNIEAALIASVPIVEGTTGWDEKRAEIERLVNNQNGAMVYAANFSLGVNLFYRLLNAAAEIFSNFSQYDVFIEEQHHKRKKDAPSGTALKLAAIIEKHFRHKAPISSTRAGFIPGTHRIGFDSDCDQILLEHTARNRSGFAEGSLLAARWIIGKKGFYSFDQVIGQIIEDIK